MIQLRDNRRVMTATGGVALLLLLSFCETTVAQSGRRANRTAPTATPLPAPTPIPEVPAAIRKKFAALRYPVHLLIAKQYTSKHLASETVIFNSFIHRLNEMPNIEGTLIGDLKRNQAAKRALSETDAYVVLLQFEI